MRTTESSDYLLLHRESGQFRPSLSLISAGSCISIFFLGAPLWAGLALMGTGLALYSLRSEDSAAAFRAGTGALFLISACCLSILSVPEKEDAVLSTSAVLVLVFLGEICAESACKRFCDRNGLKELRTSINRLFIFFECVYVLGIVFAWMGEGHFEGAFAVCGLSQVLFAGAVKKMRMFTGSVTCGPYRITWNRPGSANSSSPLSERITAECKKQKKRRNSPRADSSLLTENDYSALKKRAALQRQKLNQECFSGRNRGRLFLSLMIIMISSFAVSGLLCQGVYQGEDPKIPPIMAPITHLVLAAVFMIINITAVQKMHLSFSSFAAAQTLFLCGGGIIAYIFSHFN